MALSIEDIVALSKAGFTASQIAELNAAPQQPEPAPAPVQQPEPAPAPAPAPQPEPAPAPQPSAAHSVDDVLAAITGLSATIQNANLIQAQMPTEQKTAETILASIINPPKKEV